MTPLCDSNGIGKYFDKVYLINLIEQPERLNFMIEQLKRNGFYDELVKDDKLEIVRAVKQPGFNKEVLDKYNEVNSSFMHSTGLYFCSMEHYRTVKKAINEKYRRILILEDDACFIKNTELLYDAFDKAPDDFNILHFEGFVLTDDDYNPTTSEWDEMLADSPEKGEWIPSGYFRLLGAASLIYSYEGMKAVVKNFEEERVPFDFCTQNCENSYIYTYPLVRQCPRDVFQSNTYTDANADTQNHYITKSDYSQYWQYGEIIIKKEETPMIGVNKKLVFHFYIGKEGIDTECNNFHFICLEHYASNLFQKVLFVISVDDEEASKDEIIKLKNKVLDIFHAQEIEFKIVENTYLREVPTFYNEIVAKLNDINEIVFFGHNKGVTNVKKFNKEIILKWIAAMYFSCFGFIKDVEYDLTDNRCVAYGGLLNEISKETAQVHPEVAAQLGKNRYLYTGTFFWINPMMLRQYIYNNEITIPEINDRWYAENFLANVVPITLCSCPGYFYSIDFLGAHGKITELLGYVFPDNFMKSFNEFYNTIKLKMKDTADMPVIEIIYIATNEYINFMDGFLSTLKYFYPGAKKILKIITNKDITVEAPNSDVVRCEVIKTFDLFYPCINLHKAKFIEQLPHDDCEYIFYFDADTRFIDNPSYNWEGLRESMDKGYFLISVHPIYAIKDEEYKNSFLNNLLGPGITDKNELYASYIADNEYTYVISSFFCGRKETVLHVCRGINEMILSDMVYQKRYHIPRFSDENYFNRLVHDREIGANTEYCIRIDFFTCIETQDNNHYPALFLYQKGFGEEFKGVKR